MDTAVFFASQISLLSDVSGSPEPENNSKKLQFLPIIFFVVDIIDIILDILFSIQLFRRDKVLNGCIMVTMILVSIGLWQWSRPLLREAFTKTTLHSQVICFFEMAFFFIQDATTIYILTDTENIFEDNFLAAINLLFTVLCGLMVMTSDFVLTFRLPECCCNQVSLLDKVKAFLTLVFNSIYFLWNFGCFSYLVYLAFLIIMGYAQNEFLFWAITTGFWLCVVIFNVLIIQREEEVTEFHLSHLGPRLIIVTCFPCFIRNGNLVINADSNADSNANIHVPDQAFSNEECVVAEC